MGTGSNVFQWAIANSPCITSVSTVTITVDKLPTTAVAGSNQTLCATSPSTTLTGNTPGIGLGVWTLVAGTGTVTSPNSATTTVTGLGLGDNEFEWAIFNGACSPSVSNLTITVIPPPTTASAGPSQTICISTGSVVMAANTPTDGIGAWNLLSGSGTITNSLSPTTTITGLAVGTTIFQWQIANSPCASSSSTIAIIVDDIPSISNAGVSQTLCISNPNTIMAANTPTVGVGTWSLVQEVGQLPIHFLLLQV